MTPLPRLTRWASASRRLSWYHCSLVDENPLDGSPPAGQQHRRQHRRQHPAGDSGGRAPPGPGPAGAASVTHHYVTCL
ncbi:hypothetical protein, partial [Parafrankia sp. Ea1.12]|uniref:hypothetical protein n=1 Tax=Parafrankia sp. Ea1.12 TaxID=573499 RepID=UPI00135B8267